MALLPFPETAKKAPAPRPLGSTGSLITTALIVAGIVARTVGRAAPRRHSSAGRRRSDKGERPATITEVVTHIPADSARIVLQTIALQAQSLTGSELAAAGIAGDAVHPFRIWAHVGMPPEQVEQIGRAPRAVGLFAAILRENRTLRVRDVQRGPAGTRRTAIPHVAQHTNDLAAYALSALPQRRADGEPVSERRGPGPQERGRCLVDDDDRR